MDMLGIDVSFLTLERAMVRKWHLFVFEEVLNFQHYFCNILFVFNIL